MSARKLWKKPFKTGGSDFQYIDLRELEEHGVKPGRRAMRDPNYKGDGEWWECGRKTKSTREANGWLDAYESLAAALVSGVPMGLKFDDRLVAAYLTDRAQTVGTTSLQRSGQVTRELLKDFGGKSVNSIDIFETLGRMRAEPILRGKKKGHARSIGQLADLFNQLRVFLAWLNEPPRSCAIPLPSRPSWLKGSEQIEARVGYTAEEVDRILAHADQAGLGDLVRLQIATGVRIGEAFALRWEDIEEFEGFLIVHVERQVERAKGVEFIKKTKSARERFTGIGRHGVELALSVGQRSGWIIDRDVYSKADRAYRAVLEAADLRVEGQLWHRLRHTFAFFSLEDGASYEDLAEWLGHTTPNITRKHYPGMDRRRRAVAALKRAQKRAALAAAV